MQIFHIITISVPEVARILSPLHACTSKILASHIQEDMWRKYHQIQASIISSLDGIIHNHQMSAVVIFRTTEEIVSSSVHPAVSMPSLALSKEQITSEEHDIVCYIGGYILFRSKHIFAGSQTCLHIVSSFVKSGPPSNKLIAVKKSPNHSYIVW